MGGHVFEQDGLSTPRLSTELYNRLKEDYAAAVAPFYDKISYVKEIPSKPDHGDIDMLVEGPHATTTAERVAEALGAAKHKRNGPITSFAVPHPEVPAAYVQLDIQACPPGGYLAWQRFLFSYGDLARILGIMNRPMGLTATDRGLFVRVEAVEAVNRKASMVPLTRDPDAAAAFLGLDVAAYHAGFATEDAAFAWAARNRFFRRAAIVHEPDGGGGDGGAVVGVGQGSSTPNEKHTDRQRRAKRDMYRRFVDAWLPAHPDAGAACAWTRDEVLAAALDAFPHARPDYEARLRAHRQACREEAFWRRVKEAVPRKRDSLALVVRGLKRWVRVHGVEGEEPVASVLEEPLPEAKSVWTEGLREGGEEALLAWVEGNWPEVQAKEKAWAKARKAAGSNGGVAVAAQ